LEGKPMVFHFIEDNLDKYALYKMCKVLGTSVLAYYRWRDKLLYPSQRQKGLIKKEITAIFHENKGLYGTARIWAELQ
ncbi:IS3 family transposase, partial [Flavobacterium sp. 3-210]